VERITGKTPKFPLAERRYTLESVRFVRRVQTIGMNDSVDELPPDTPSNAIWAMAADQMNDQRRAWAGRRGVRLIEVPLHALKTFPPPLRCPVNATTGRKKVVVTGCFDWLHSGHVRFFEEVSEIGDLYVVVGHDANIRLLKGEGHPQFPEHERVYMVNAFRHVTCAVVSSGQGWLDGEPEFRRLCPDVYAVNEDGDKPEKRKYCQDNGIEYRVLKRLPKPGLPARASTALRGF
jgi:cytidyltransferase-like protein